MLADNLSAGPYQSVFHRRVFEHAQQTLAHAARFTLDRDVIVAAYRVTETTPSSILQGLPLCRLPYPITWFEYAGKDLPGSAASGTAIPHRVGLLCEAVTKSCDGFTATVFWHSGGKRDCVEICPVALLIDLTVDGRLAQEPDLAAQKHGATIEALQGMLLTSKRPRNHKVAASRRELEAALALSNRIYFIGSRYFVPLASAIVRRSGARGLERLLQMSRPNAEAEAALLVAVLMLLNTRNGVDREPADLGRLNAARVKRGSPPLLDHWTVTLRLSGGRSRALEHSGLSTHEIRAHLVRGHFKVRKSGIYWWSPHIRGDAESGIVKKEYTVKL
jgi:hypothetical protein